MVKLYKEQVLLIMVSFLILIVIGFYALTTSISIDTKDTKGRYQKSLDSVNFVAQSLYEFNNSEYVYTKDIFNFKVIKKKVKPIVIKENVKKEVIKKATNIKWVDTVIPYDKEKIEMILYVNGKAKMKINGKFATLSIGEKVPIGTLIQKQMDLDTKRYTGKTRNRGVYKGKIEFINGRATYVLSVGDNAFKLKPNLDPSLIKQAHIPTSKKSKSKIRDKKKAKSSSGRKRERQ